MGEGSKGGVNEKRRSYKMYNQARQYKYHRWKRFNVGAPTNLTQKFLIIIFIDNFDDKNKTYTKIITITLKRM